MKSKDGYWFPDSDTHFNMYTFEYGHFYDLQHLLKEKRTVVEGGAHVGGWTRELSKAFDRVIAIEPDPNNFECLQANTEGMGNVELLNCALGDKNSRGSLHPPVSDGNSGAAWVIEGDDFDVITIDSLGLDDVDFIKLDVEGYEPFAISGAVETIERCKPVILAEQKPITARYGVPHNEPGMRLYKMGYEMVLQLGNDFVYAT